MTNKMRQICRILLVIYTTSIAKDCFFGIIQRLQNKVSLCFGDFYRKPEEIQTFGSLFSFGTNQIPLQMQIEFTELQNREITKDGFN
jgi:hypothetical protein